MALLTVQSSLPTAGLVPAYTAVNSTDTVSVADDRAYLVVKNASGSGITVTIVTPGTVSGLAIADPTYAVAAAGERHIPLPNSLFQDPATGLITIQYSAVTSVTAAVVRH